MAEGWQVPMVRDALMRASDVGDTLSIQEIREQVGIGSDDLATALDQLRRGGEASEVTPGEWGLAAESERQGFAEQPRAAEEEPAAEAASLAAPRRPEPPRGAGRLSAPEDTPRVQITRAMLDALDDESLGKLVRAGVAGVDEDGPFAFVVLP